MGSRCSALGSGLLVELLNAHKTRSVASGLDAQKNLAQLAELSNCSKAPGMLRMMGMMPLYISPVGCRHKCLVEILVTENLRFCVDTVTSLQQNIGIMLPYAGLVCCGRCSLAERLGSAERTPLHSA